MADGQTFLDWVGISGVISLIATAVGIGKVQQKLDHHGKELEKIKSDALTLARLDERVDRIRDDIAEIKEVLRDVAAR